jgi:hypothetical protein
VYHQQELNWRNVEYAEFAFGLNISNIGQVHALVPQNMKRKVTELLTTHLLRQALHSWRLQFTQPLSGKQLDLTAPLPEDLLYTLDWLDRYFAIDTEMLDINSLLQANKEW